MLDQRSASCERPWCRRRRSTGDWRLLLRLLALPSLSLLGRLNQHSVLDPTWRRRRGLCHSITPPRCIPSDFRLPSDGCMDLSHVCRDDRRQTTRAELLQPPSAPSECTSSIRLGPVPLRCACPLCPAQRPLLPFSDEPQTPRPRSLVSAIAMGAVVRP